MQPKPYRNTTRFCTLNPCLYDMVLQTFLLDFFLRGSVPDCIIGLVSHMYCACFNLELLPISNIFLKSDPSFEMKCTKMHMSRYYSRNRPIMAIYQLYDSGGRYTSGHAVAIPWQFIYFNRNQCELGSMEAQTVSRMHSLYH